jgi:hypothetical protein
MDTVVDPGIDATITALCGAGAFLVMLVGGILLGEWMRRRKKV